MSRSPVTEILKEVAGPAVITLEVQGQQIIKARLNISREAIVTVEEEQAAVDPLMAMEIQKVFNA